MRAVIGGKLDKIDGQKKPIPFEGQETKQNQAERTDRIVRNVVSISAARISFGDLARFAWPQKAEANLSLLTGYDGRTCRRWLAGDTEPPAEALGVILAEIMKRFHQR
jgi:hypothetical protein